MNKKFLSNFADIEVRPEIFQILYRENFQFDFIQHPGAWSVHIREKHATDTDSGDAYGGTAVSKSIALQKAISEFVERRAMRDCKDWHALSYPDSTGFAARPWNDYFRSITRKRVRDSALLEACERFYAVAWWYDPSIGMKVEMTAAGEMSKFFSHLSMLGIEREFAKIVFVQIKSSGWEDVILILGFLPQGGIVCGWSAGWIWQRSSTLFRASCEMMRHLMIVKANRLGRKTTESLYLKKLLLLASGALDDEVRNRLQKNGRSKIIMPKILVDTEIIHDLKDAYYVHRCVLQDQPDILAFNEDPII